MQPLESGAKRAGSIEMTCLSAIPHRTEPLARRPVHFLHIRKTGGTAIIEALKPVAQSHGIELHPHATKLRDVPDHHQVIFFVRHPVSRFVSGFYSRLRRGHPRHHYEWNPAETRAFSHFQKANELAEALSSPNPAIAEQAQEAMRGISHLKNTYKEWFSGEEELEERLSSILLLGLQEELASDFERLKRILYLPPTVSLPTDDILAHRTPAGFDMQLSELAVRNLSHWYADDIHFYEYCVRLRAILSNSRYK